MLKKFFTLRLLLTLCGLTVVLAACETAPVSGRSQIMLVSESEERDMGLKAYREVLSKEPLSGNTQANALVEKVGRRIAAAAERPPEDMWRAPHFRWEFKTIDKNEPNAFCLPGGKIAGLHRPAADHPDRGRPRRGWSRMKWRMRWHAMVRSA